jgi:hypothetical protein
MHSTIFYIISAHFKITDLKIKVKKEEEKNEEKKRGLHLIYKL